MKLADLTNMNINDVSDMNFNLAKRLLYAYHVSNARTLKSRQNERIANGH